MTSIQFDNDDEFARKSEYSPSSQGLTKLVMKLGLAKDEKTAQYVLLGLVIFCIALSAFIFLHNSPRLPVVKDFSKMDGVMPTVNQSL